MFDLDEQQQAARDWFESLRDRICAAFEEIGNAVARHRERQAALHDHCIDADHAAACIGQRPPRVSGSEPDRGLHPFLSAQTTQRTDAMDHSGCERTGKSKGIANG